MTLKSNTQLPIGVNLIIPENGYLGLVDQDFDLSIVEWNPNSEVFFTLSVASKIKRKKRQIKEKIWLFTKMVTSGRITWKE